MRNNIERATEYTLHQELEDLRRQIQEMRAVQKTLLTLGGASAGNGLIKLLNAAGAEIIRLDQTGVNVHGQAMQLKDSAGVLKGYFAYGIGGGNAVVIDATPSGGNVNLISAIGAVIKFTSDSVILPLNTNAPATGGYTGAAYFNTSDNTWRVFDGTIWRKVALT